jgi:hypothetical protein
LDFLDFFFAFFICLIGPFFEVGAVVELGAVFEVGAVVELGAVFEVGAVVELGAVFLAITVFSAVVVDFKFKTLPTFGIFCP